MKDGWFVYGDYIVEDTKECNCGSEGGPFGHEPGCGLELVMTVNEWKAEQES